MTSDVIDQLKEQTSASTLGSEVSDELIAILRSDPDAKKDWERVKLSDIVEIVGRGITPKYNEVEGLLVINQRCIRDGRIVFENARRHDLDLKSVSSSKYLKLNDIIVNSTGVGTLGRTAFVDLIVEPMTVDTHVTIVRPDSKVNPVWLKYFISSSENIIEDMAEGSTGQTELKREKLGALEMDLPPLHIQKQIADLLSVFDEKIELLRAQNKTLESIAQAIYKRWFVDFEFPMSEQDAKALGKPDLAGQPYKSSGGKMKPSELGEIPNDFSVGTVTDVIEKLPVRYRCDLSDLDSSGFTPIIDQGESGLYGFTSREPDILASKNDPVIVFTNHTCNMWFIDSPFCAIQNVLPFKAKSGFDIYWLFYMTYGQIQFQEYKGHWPDFVQKEYPLSYGNLTRNFGTYISGLQSKIWGNNNQISSNNRARKLLIKKLI